MTAHPTDHVKLNNAPLKRVICQVRFPPLLGFGPTGVRPFQKAIEDEYPDVETERVLAGLHVLGAETTPTTIDLKEVFRFVAADGHTRVTLTEDFLSLETTAYSRFPDFLANWEQVLRAAIQTMELRRQARLGLRFTNVIEQEHAETLDQWSGLIEDHLLTDVRYTAELFSGATFASQHMIRLTTSTGAVAFRHGYPSLPGEELPAGYFLDIDNYDDRPTVIDVERHRERLVAWDHQSYQLLHGSVTQTLWESFKPEGGQ
jgi:uncharacterized protein (TIGR04255 family)